MANATLLSEQAQGLLIRRVARERVDLTDETRSLYRELVVAGFAIPLHTVTGGDESAYRLTVEGVNDANHLTSSRAPASWATVQKHGAPRLRFEAG